MGQSTILRQLSSGKPGNTHPGSGLCKMSQDELVASFCAKGGRKATWEPQHPTGGGLLSVAMPFCTSHQDFFHVPPPLPDHIPPVFVCLFVFPQGLTK